MGQIKVNPEFIQQKIDTVSISITNTDSYLTYVNTLTGTASVNTLPSSLTLSPINLSAPTSAQPDILSKMESAALKHLQIIFSELGRNANVEVTNTITTIARNMQTAKNTWIQTDEEIAGTINE